MHTLLYYRAHVVVLKNERKTNLPSPEEDKSHRMGANTVFRHGHALCGAQHGDVADVQRHGYL